MIITGKLTTSVGSTIQWATIIFDPSVGSSISFMTDKDGNYSYDVPAGVYRVFRKDKYSTEAKLLGGNVVVAATGTTSLEDLLDQGIPSYTAATMPTSLSVGQSVVVDAVSLALQTPLGLSTLPSITPYPRNRAGIVAAINALRTVSKAGVVMFEDAVYDVSLDSSQDPIIPYRGISFIGVRPSFAFNGHVPDQFFTLTDGTIFDGKNSQGVVDGAVFELNNSDQVSATSSITASGATLARTANQFASNGQGGSLIEGIGARNVKRLFDTGGKNNIGLLYTDVSWCVCENSIDDFAFKFHNFQHCKFSYLFAKSTLSTGSGFDFSANVDSSVLLPGNSTIDEIYSFAINPTNRGVRFGSLSTGLAGSQLNEVRVGRCQSNRYGSTATRSISVTSTAGSPLLSVSAADAAWLKPDMTVVFNVSVPQWGTLNQTYFVQAVDTVANTITLADVPMSTAGITWNQSGTYVVQSGGFSSFSIVGAGNSLITACRWDGIDVECTGSTSPIVISRLRNSRATVYECFAAAVGKSIVRRDTSMSLHMNNLSGVTIDDDANVLSNLSGLGTRNIPVIANTTLVGAHHQASIVNTGTSAITITVTKDLPRGFGCEMIQGSTGQIAVSPASGVTITNSVGLKTAGPQAVVRLVETGKNTYVLTGNTVA